MEQYKITLEQFEGPMDLLLHLIKETKMDIYEVKISEIIEQYLQYIEAMQALNIETSSAFLVMAAELIHLKSKKLIGKLEPVEDSEFSLESEDDLKQKLIEYQQFKMITKELKELEEKRNEVFTKVPESLKAYEVQEILESNILTADDLMNAFLKMQERLKFHEPVTTKITKKELSVEDQSVRIRDIIKEKKEVYFDELFTTFTKEYVVVTFLAILQMSKNEEIMIKQSNNFEKIWIEGKTI